MKTFNTKVVKGTEGKRRVSLKFSYFIFCKLLVRWKTTLAIFRKTTMFQRLALMNDMNSYRSPTTDLSHFKPMFYFYTPYTPCNNKKPLNFWYYFLGSGREVGKGNAGLKWVNYKTFQRNFVWISNANRWLY